MGLFDKFKEIVTEAKDQVTQIVAQKLEEEKRRQEEEKARQDEEKRRQEEEKKKQDEAARFNPEGKNLQWFGSEDGIKTFKEYMTAQNYFLEEKIKNEYGAEYGDFALEAIVSVYHKDSKLPFVYFRKLAEKMDVQAMTVIPATNLLVALLLMQARPYYVDDDGEPKPFAPIFTPEEIVSVEKNPILNYVKNFDCFELKDDAQGNLQEKWALWSAALNWVFTHSMLNKDIISKNPWIFSKEVYLNDIGTVKKPKNFYKKCIELATDEGSKDYFEKAYNECE